LGGGAPLGGDDCGALNRRPSFPLLKLDGEENGAGSVPPSTKFVREASLAAAREGTLLMVRIPNVKEHSRRKFRFAGRNLIVVVAI
jgi:hypothetical protein